MAPHFTSVTSAGFLTLPKHGEGLGGDATQTDDVSDHSGHHCPFQNPRWKASLRMETRRTG